MSGTAREQNYKIVTEFTRLAEAKSCTPGQLSLAWLMYQGPNIIPIPGTKSEKYLIENFMANKVEITQEEDEVIRKVIEECKAVGERYYPGGMDALDH